MISHRVTAFVPFVLHYPTEDYVYDYATKCRSTHNPGSCGRSSGTNQPRSRGFILASSEQRSGEHFSLDSVLHEDPRSFPATGRESSRRTGAWRVGRFRHG